MDDFQELLYEIINVQKLAGITDFEGLSPSEMHLILYETFGEESPIQLIKLSENEYKRIPIFNQIKFLAELINEQGEIKLTSRGYLPPILVKEIYTRGFIKEQLIEEGISKLSKESDSMAITLAKVLLTQSGIAKKRNNKLSLTKNGEKLLADNHKFLKQMFSAFGSKFNWAYFDGFGENNIGELGFGFSLVLLSKYGDIRQLNTFYADKYFKAFPQLLTDLTETTYATIIRSSSDCYSLRTFDRFLDYFGLIKIEQERWDSDKYISKTELFDKLIKYK